LKAHEHEKIAVGMVFVVLCPDLIKTSLKHSKNVLDSDEKRYVLIEIENVYAE